RPHARTRRDRMASSVPPLSRRPACRARHRVSLQEPLLLRQDELHRGAAASAAGLRPSLAHPPGSLRARRARARFHGRSRSLQAPLDRCHAGSPGCALVPAGGARRPGADASFRPRADSHPVPHRRRPGMKSPVVNAFKNKILKGMAWTVSFRFGQRFMGLVSTLILVRILAPKDFGIVAMGMAVGAVLDAISSFGFDQAIIQRKEIDRTHLDTAWTINQIVSAIATVVLLLLAPVVAAYYGDPRVINVIIVLAI